MFKESELSVNARGGTELMVSRIKNGLKDFALASNVDIYVSRVRNFNSERKSIYWVHDLPEDPESAHLKNDLGARFDAIVFVSHYQYNRYMKYFGKLNTKCVVIPNSIEDVTPSIESEYRWNDEIKLIYHTTPHRGLVLVENWINHELPKIKTDKKVTLDVYSSFKIYGWEDRDAPFKATFDSLRNNPNVKVHNVVDNDEIRKILRNSNIFVYPSIWEETFCLAALEAVVEGNIIVGNTYGALPEIFNGMDINDGVILSKFEPDINEIYVNFCNDMNFVIRHYDELISKDTYGIKKQLLSKYNVENSVEMWKELIVSIQ